MKCSKCQNKMKVIDTQNIDNETFRSYKCIGCNELITTSEVINMGSIIWIDINKVKKLEMYE